MSVDDAGSSRMHVYKLYPTYIHLHTHIPKYLVTVFLKKKHDNGEKHKYGEKAYICLLPRTLFY